MGLPRNNIGAQFHCSLTLTQPAKKSALCYGEGKDRHAVSLLGAAPALAPEYEVKERTVVVEYPSLEKATAAYDSSAYEEALKAPGDGAVRDFRIVEGVE